MKETSKGPMTGKTVLVTGATSGIGKATALGLATMGAHVAIVGRDRRRTEEVAREICAATAGQVDVFVADLSAQSEVRPLADEVLQTLPRIDVLVNNVGGFWNNRHVTVDGPERTFALNHLAPFLLTNLLLDRLKRDAAARAVTVASNAQALGRIDSDDLQAERSYSGARAYNQSKLANVLFTYELARRLRGSGVTANALVVVDLATGGTLVRADSHCTFHGTVCNGIRIKSLLLPQAQQDSIQSAAAWISGVTTSPTT
jgi:NAD(P)-dependent dehydrogenase (short-subunit alcohol dehydrogenase family)